MFSKPTAALTPAGTSTVVAPDAGPIVAVEGQPVTALVTGTRGDEVGIVVDAPIVGTRSRPRRHRTRPGVSGTRQ
ncbi:hypothetical protein [Nocardia sp. NPDC003963]